MQIAAVIRFIVEFKVGFATFLVVLVRLKHLRRKQKCTE